MGLEFSKVFTAQGGTAVRIKNTYSEYPEFPDVPIDVYDFGIDVNLKGQFINGTTL